MKRFVWVLMLALAVGCSSKKEEKPSEVKKTNEEDDHEHGPGPHGGTLFDFCGEKYHLEIDFDHDKKEAKLWVLDGKTAKKATPIKVDTMILMIKEPKLQINLEPKPQKDDPEGMCSYFVGKHESFGKKQEFKGTVRAFGGSLPGKACAGDFEEKEHHK